MPSPLEYRSIALATSTRGNLGARKSGTDQQQDDSASSRLRLMVPSRVGTGLDEAVVPVADEAFSASSWLRWVSSSPARVASCLEYE